MLWKITFIVLISTPLFSQLKEEKVLSNTSNYTVEYLPFNSSANDYHAVPYRKGIVFVSSRNSRWGITYSSTTGSPFTDLFFSEPEKGNWTTPKRLSKSINTKLNEGPFCFNETGNILYYTSNGGVANTTRAPKEIKLKIFKAELINNTWTNFEPFLFNNENFGVGHPSLSKNGKLFFASDMPGGFGGSDIYVSFYHHNQWTKPANLGDKVNTPGNESFPFISADSILYFSSNGHPGLGNMDIYSAQLIDSEWKMVKDLKAPINSPYDDFSFILEKNGTGYLSSNRRNHKDDDIYKFQSLKDDCDTLKEISKCFTFYEEATISGENLPLVYEWDLGDGTRIRGLEASHCFSHEGDFKINLNIIDTLTKQIYSNEASYVINVESILTPYIEIKDALISTTAIQFDGRKSKVAGGRIKEYIWDFGDGTKFIGPLISHVYANAGIYKVHLELNGTDSVDHEFERCVFKIINVKDIHSYTTEIPKDTLKKIGNIAQTIYSVIGDTNLLYTVQVATSETPIPINQKNFKGLKDVNEYVDKGTYKYITGEGKTLEELYPLYHDVRILGFGQAQVVPFKNKKILSAKDTESKQLLNGKTYTRISGKVINRFGDPMTANVVLENLSTGKIILRFKNDPDGGKYDLELPNGEIFGYYAEKDSFYSISNFIDLRNEKRNLEIKKNIELINYADLDENNLALRINNLFFGNNKYNISKESYPELKRMASMIHQEGDLKVEISGHSDNIGNEVDNISLSQKRAEAVKRYLTGLGCSKERLKAIGYGSSMPLVSNHTERGKYLNRRVEIRFLKE